MVVLPGLLMQKRRQSRNVGILALPSNVEKSDPNGTRTRVAGVKGRSPRPLDDGAPNEVAQ